MILRQRKLCRRAIAKMIIINCANCAAELPHDNTGCVRYLFEESPAACARCQTRYCDATCRRAHWDGGGHRDVCSEIARAGGAEQHHADQKYAEATAAAIEAHAEATAGQTCYICMADAAESAEGLVRGCACRGDNGYVHLSCLVRHAQSAVEAAIARQPGVEVPYIAPQLIHWFKCRLCEQNYHGTVAIALGWGSWKTYCSWSDWAWARTFAMENLGTALYRTEPKVALAIVEILLARRIDIGDVLLEGGTLAQDMCHLRGLIAGCLSKLGRHAECLALQREIWAACPRFGELVNYGAAIDLACSLLRDDASSSISEAIELTRELIPLALEEYGPHGAVTNKLRHILALALCSLPRLSLDSMIEGEAILTDVIRVSARALGPEHPDVPGQYRRLAGIRAYLEAARYQGEEWRKGARSNRALLAHIDVVDELNQPNKYVVGYTARREAPYSLRRQRHLPRRSRFGRDHLLAIIRVLLDLALRR